MQASTLGVLLANKHIQTARVHGSRDWDHQISTREACILKANAVAL